MAERQSDGRDKNGAVPAGRPTPKTDDKDVTQVGGQERQSAGPDGPDAKAVGDTFKR